MVDVPSFVNQHLREYDEQGNHNVTVEPRHTKGSRRWAIAGAQSADWMALGSELRSRFDAALLQNNGTWFVVASPHGKEDWRLLAAKIGGAVLSLAIMLYLMFFADGALQLPTGKELRSLALAAMMTVAGKLSWPHIQQMLATAAAAKKQK